MSKLIFIFSPLLLYFHMITGPPDSVYTRRRPLLPMNRLPLQRGPTARQTKVTEGIGVEGRAGYNGDCYENPDDYAGEELPVGQTPPYDELKRREEKRHIGSISEPRNTILSTKWLVKEQVFLDDR